MFLKTSRLVKRRTIAQGLCTAGKVLVNGSPAKPAKEVKAGDVLLLSYVSRRIEIAVLAVPASLKKGKMLPEELYRVTREQGLSQTDL